MLNVDQNLRVSRRTAPSSVMEKKTGTGATIMACKRDKTGIARCKSDTIDTPAPSLVSSR